MENTKQNLENKMKKLEEHIKTKILDNRSKKRLDKKGDVWNDKSTTRLDAKIKILEFIASAESEFNNKRESLKKEIIVYHANKDSIPKYGVLHDVYESYAGLIKEIGEKVIGLDEFSEFRNVHDSASEFYNRRTIEDTFSCGSDTFKKNKKTPDESRSLIMTRSTFESYGEEYLDPIECTIKIEYYLTDLLK